MPNLSLDVNIMKSIKNKSFSRSVRLEKGYKTRLKNILKKKGFGGIEFVAQETGLDRDTVASIRDNGKCNRTNKAKIETFIDLHAPIKNIKHERLAHLC